MDEIQKALFRAEEINRIAESEGREITSEEKLEFDNCIKSAEDAKILQVNKEARHAQLVKAQEEFKKTHGRKSTIVVGQSNENDLVHNDVHKFSILKAANDMVNYGQLRGLEAEVNSEMVKRRNGKLPENMGFYVPSRQSLKYSNTDTSTAAGFLNTPVLYDEMVPLLRNRMYVQQLGATVLTGLNGNASIPRQSGASTVYWTDGSLTSNVTASNQTADNIALVEKSVGASVAYPRNLLRQSGIDVENFVRNDIAKVVALGIDAAALNGSGSGSIPTGILQNGSVPAITLAGDSGNGAACVFSDLIAMESSVASYNADLPDGSLAYLMTPKLRGKLKSTPKVATYSANMVWEPGNEVNGYPAFATNQMPANLTKGTSSGVCSSAIFGPWSELILAFWEDGLTFIVNPYANDLNGGVRLTMQVDMTIALKHATSFAIINTATT